MTSLPSLNGFALRSLLRALSHPSAIFNRNLDAKLREQVILRVSSINNCMVCSAVHDHVAKFQGISECEIRSARGYDKPNHDKTELALRYAELRTQGLEADFPDEITRFNAEFDKNERDSIAAWADLYSFFNRFNNSWEGLLPGASRRRSKLGLPPPKSEK